MDNLQRFIAKYLDDELSPSDRAQLERTLLSDEALLREFAELLLVDEKLRSETIHSPAVQLALDERASTESRARYSSRFFWATAACLLIAATIGVSYSRWHRPAAQVELAQAQQDLSQQGDSDALLAEEDFAEAPSTDEDRRRVAAYVGRTSNCIWKSAAFTEGGMLQPGTRITLESGVAELIFDSGDRVTAQGPCDLVVNDPQAFTLIVGDVSVEARFGFKVVTPSGIVLDLGTEFGVSVDEKGASEVHVFKGGVAFQAIGAGGNLRNKPLVLSADQACRYSIDGIELHEFEANEAKFDWRTRHSLLDSEVPPLPVRRGLALWLAADKFVEVDEDNHVERWRDLLVGDNTAAEDALQLDPEHRPTLIENAIRGKPGIRFGEGGPFLLTPPLTTTNEQTFFVVCSMFSSSPVFQQIINYNGPPQRMVSQLGGFVTPAVFEACMRDPAKTGRLSVCGEVFSGFTGINVPENVVKDMVEAPGYLKVNEPVVACFRYSLQEERMTLIVNGVEEASKQAKLPVAITSRKIIGRHPYLDGGRGNFHGDIGEMLIFNCALAEDEVRLVSDYLSRRFQVGDATSSN